MAQARSVVITLEPGEQRATSWTDPSAVLITNFSLEPIHRCKLVDVSNVDATITGWRYASFDPSDDDQYREKPAIASGESHLIPYEQYDAKFEAAVYRTPDIPSISFMTANGMWWTRRGDDEPRRDLNYLATRQH